MGQFAGSPLSFLPTANSHFWLLYLELIPHLLVLTVSFCPSCFCDWQFSHIKVKVKWTRYRPCVAQWVGRGIALLFRDRYTRRGWVVSSTPRPHFTPVKNRYPFYRRMGGPQGGKSRPHWHSIPDLPASSQSLYRLSYPGHQFIRDFEMCTVSQYSKSILNYTAIIQYVLNSDILIQNYSKFLLYLNVIFFNIRVWTQQQLGCCSKFSELYTLPALRWCKPCVVVISRSIYVLCIEWSVCT